MDEPRINIINLPIMAKQARELVKPKWYEYALNVAGIILYERRAHKTHGEIIETNVRAGMPETDIKRIIDIIDGVICEEYPPLLAAATAAEFLIIGGLVSKLIGS